MAMLCTVMAWGTTRTAGSFAALQDAISAAAAGDVIQLTADITATSTITVGKSISIDGQNHKISGTVADNGIFKLQGTSDNQLQVTFADVEIENVPASGQNVILYLNGYIDSLAINRCALKCTKNSGNPKPIEFRGTQLQAAKIGIHDSQLYGNTSGYAYRAYNPAILYIDNSQIEGFGCLNFQYPRNAGELGARGTKVYAKNCDFDSPNVHSGGWNSFMAFNFADDGISMELDNCGMNAEVLGNQGQAIFGTNGWNLISRRTEDISIVIKGDNSHINGTFMDPGFIVNYNGDYDDVWENGFWSTYPSDAWWEAHPEANDFNYFYHKDYNLETGYDPAASFASKNTADISLTITGGTYAVNPSEYKWKMHVATSDPETHMPLTWTEKGIAIPDGYEVKEVKQGDVTLYRVVKKAEEKAPGVKYDLNDDVPTDEPGAGNNPASSFDLSTGEDMTLNQEVTTAGYVQVKDHATEGATTVIVDKTAGGDEQRLIINNGLDVQGESSVEVKPGAAIIIGEGGINTQKPENIVIESTEEAQGVLLLDPTITVNQNPELTVKLKTHSKLNAKISPTRWEYTYQRFAIPVMLATAGYVTDDFDPATNEYFDEEEAGVGFESYVWQWTGMKWETTTWNALERSIGYQLANNSKNGDVTYTFTGNLIGNTNTIYEFDVKGFKFFGNSYTAPIMIEELLNGFKEIYPDVEASVWVYNYANKGWKPVTLDDLADGFAYATTIKSMDGFILNLRSANSGVAGVDYTSAIWNNPEINPNATPAPARRSNASTVTNGVIINVAASEVGDDLTLVERDDRNSSFENGADASKVMNESGLNIYAETPAGTLSRVATDNLLGTQITFDAIDEEQYTLSFSNVRGSSYALRDNVTEKVIDLVEGGTYEFTQAANSSVTNRFEIVSVANAPTAIDNVENNVKAKGVYTVLGQYVGEASQWSTLPAGVYVVDGVKVVK